jgi:hypothetical protein
MKEQGKGLWYNIRKRKASGKRMRKPGEKGAPSAADLKRAKGEDKKIRLTTPIGERAERDYKREYKKFQSSPERIEYRKQLVQYNRDKGTYGNGDGKDASHKGKDIVGFEDASKNRGRKEKSRLKGYKEMSKKK